MIRRRAIRATFLATLTTMAGAVVLVAVASGGASHITVEANGQNKFDPDLLATSVGTLTPNVEWDWGVDGTTNRRHNVRQDKRLFYSGKPTNDRNPFRRWVSAGTFRYYCERHGGPGGAGMAGKINVSPEDDGAVTENTVPIRWAVDESTTGDQYDVRFKVGENGEWRTWKRNTAQRRGVFGRNDNPVDYTVTKKYYVQARSEKSANPKRRSGWSRSFFFGNTPF